MQSLILTALLEEKTQSFFNGLRRQHFPPERNHIDAHVTLFHALPGEQQAAIEAELQTYTTHAPVNVTVTEVFLLGGGVAYRMQSAELMQMRTELANKWQDRLTNQDGNKRELHVTVQNKVDAATARQLRQELVSDFEPFETQAVGLGLWRYLGAEWEPIRSYSFAGQS